MLKYILKAASNTYQKTISKKIDKNTISLIYYLDKNLLTHIKRPSDKLLIQIAAIDNIRPIINNNPNYKDNKKSDLESGPKIMNTLESKLAEIENSLIPLPLLIIEKCDTLIEQLIFSALNISMTNRKKQ